MKKKILHFIVLSAILLVFAPIATAAPVYWADWTSETATAPGVLGTITTDSSTIGVSFSGAYASAQLSGGTNYWSAYEATYTSTLVDNAPATTDIIRLSTAGTATITFSETVSNPLLALVSWNGNTVDFGGLPIAIVSYGPGAYGSGTPIMNADGDGFYGSGEVHGVIQVLGDYTSISFTHTSENWHGFTLGLLGSGEPPVGVPEPISMLLLGFGLLGLAGTRRKFNS